MKVSPQRRESREKRGDSDGMYGREAENRYDTTTDRELTSLEKRVGGVAHITYNVT